MAEIRNTVRLTIERARDVLRYEPESGEIYWKVTLASGGCVGKRAGAIYKSGYRMISVDGERFRSGRLAWFLYYGCWPIAEIDHRNRDRADDRISNLRDSTRSQNQTNAKHLRPNKTGFRGVSQQGKKWLAIISIEGRNRLIGRFETPQIAHEAYVFASQIFRGEYFAI